MTPAPVPYSEPELARILVVDDEEPNRKLLERLLRHGGFTNVRLTGDPTEVLAIAREFQPHLVLLDLRMPLMTGFEVLAELRGELPAETFLPVVVLTADADPESRLRALAAGAQDFLSKPFDNNEVLLRVRNHVLASRLHAQLRESNSQLERRVRERTRQLNAAHLDTIRRLGIAAELRDDDTGQHTARVGLVSGAIARLLVGDTAWADDLTHAAPLHDVGKIGIPDSILLKPGKLDPDEWKTMKQHTRIGARILSRSSAPLLVLAEEIARTHHERWDGSGYEGLAGDAIPLSGRIVAVADVFDALTHARPYKAAWPRDEAIAEITAQRGRQFDPAVVEAFLEVSRRVTPPEPPTLWDLSPMTPIRFLHFRAPGAPDPDTAGTGG